VSVCARADHDDVIVTVIVARPPAGQGLRSGSGDGPRCAAGSPGSTRVGVVRSIRRTSSDQRLQLDRHGRPWCGHRGRRGMGDPSVLVQIVSSVSFFRRWCGYSGSLLEGFNLAALWQLPVVYVCENTVRDHVAGAYRGCRFDHRSWRGVRHSSATVGGQDVEVVVRGGGGRGRARSVVVRRSWSSTTYRYDGHHTFELKRGCSTGR